MLTLGLLYSPESSGFFNKIKNVHLIPKLFSFFLNVRIIFFLIFLFIPTSLKCTILN